VTDAISRHVLIGRDRSDILGAIMPDLSDIVSFILGLSSGFAIKIAVDARRTTKSENQTSQQASNQAGGHIAGRDVNVNGDRKG
jgi:hypothetical protein